MNPELESQGIPIYAFCHPDAPWVTQPQSKWKKTFYVKLMVNTKTDIDQNLLYGQASILSPLETLNCPFTAVHCTYLSQKEKLKNHNTWRFTTSKISESWGSEKKTSLTSVPRETVAPKAKQTSRSSAAVDEKDFD